MGIYIFVSVLILIACIFQILIVLVQNSKGGGLAANFTSAGQTMGIRKTADFLEKATWTLAASILVMSLVATATIPKKTREVSPRTSIDAAVNPSQVPTLPTAVPPASTTAPSGTEEQTGN